MSDLFSLEQKLTNVTRAPREVFTLIPLSSVLSSVPQGPDAEMKIRNTARTANLNRSYQSI